MSNLIKEIHSFYIHWFFLIKLNEGSGKLCHISANFNL